MRLARYHISRLEAIQLQMQQNIEVLFGNQLDSLDSAMRDIYRSGYYQTAFEIQKGVGVGWDFTTLDEKQISKVINKPWAADGKNFSARVWDNRQKLVNELNTELTRNIILGQDPQKAIDAIAKKMNTSKNVAGRLVMTEEAYFSSEAQKDCFAELDVEQYEIDATLVPSRQKSAGKWMESTFLCHNGKSALLPRLSIPGVEQPRFHSLMMTLTQWGNVLHVGKMERTYYVTADTTYKEWEKAFVEGDKEGLQEVQPDDTIKVKAKAEELKVENFPAAFSGKSELKNTQALVDYVNSLEGADAKRLPCITAWGRWKMWKVTVFHSKFPMRKTTQSQPTGTR